MFLDLKNFDFWLKMMKKERKSHLFIFVCLLLPCSDLLRIEYSRKRHKVMAGAVYFYFLKKQSFKSWIRKMKNKKRYNIT